MPVNNLESLVAAVIKHSQSIYCRFFIVGNQDIGHPVSLRRILALAVKDYLAVSYCLKPVSKIPPGIDYRLRGAGFFQGVEYLIPAVVDQGKNQPYFFVAGVKGLDG